MLVFGTTEQDATTYTCDAPSYRHAVQLGRSIARDSSKRFAYARTQARKRLVEGQLYRLRISQGYETRVRWLTDGEIAWGKFDYAAAPMGQAFPIEIVHSSRDRISTWDASPLVSTHKFRTWCNNWLVQLSLTQVVLLDQLLRPQVSIDIDTSIVTYE